METLRAPMCIACEDEDPAILLGCGCGTHQICKDCLHFAAQAITTSEPAYPVKCANSDCPPISLHIIRQTLSESGKPEDVDLLERLNTKVQEYSVPRPERTYCMNEQCMAAHGAPQYLNADVYGQGNIILCPHCTSIMCQLCKTATNPPDLHICKEDPLDAEMETYLRSLPEEERWLTRKCFNCGVWVEKISACNHMTCDCGGQFCLCCGRQWKPHWSECAGGCPKNERPIYDDEGYNQDGFNPATGLNRAGIPWDLDDEPEIVYNREGYDEHGFNEAGLDRDGYSEEGYNYWGMDRDGFNENGELQHHRGRDGNVIEGYSIAPDGNVRHDGIDEHLFPVCSCTAETLVGGPTAGMPRWQRVASPGVCYLCRHAIEVDSGYECHAWQCRQAMCNACSEYTSEERKEMERLPIWERSETLGFAEMVERLARGEAAEDHAVASNVDRLFTARVIDEDKYWDATWGGVVASGPDWEDDDILKIPAGEW